MKIKIPFHLNMHYPHTLSPNTSASMYGFLTIIFDINMDAYGGRTAEAAHGESS